MGKRLTVQRRGKGSPAFLSPSHKYAGEAKQLPMNMQSGKGKITSILHCSGHTAPLMTVKWENGEEQLTIAPEGVCVNQTIEYNTENKEIGSTCILKEISEGTLIYNIEGVPGDGGKFARSGGVFAKVLNRQGTAVTVMLPSKKEKLFNENCRATIGVVSGGGRTEKPIMKAGTMFHKLKASAKLWPVVSGQSQNAVEHPHGGARSSKKNKPDIARRFAPPGAKIGKIRPRRTGRKNR
ncbi:MAG: 50S ribosomal protein L2 [Candidatus Woesearchaeota archaeon]|jgi:large subunit ribosomal protein L2